MTTNRKAVACGERMSYKTLNTRAVPLVRKEDVHHGRVFYYPSATTPCFLQAFLARFFKKQIYLRRYFIWDESHRGGLA